MLLGVSKQAYYQHDEEKDYKAACQESMAVDYIKEVRKNDPGMGVLKIWHNYMIDFAGSAPMGRDRFMEVADRYGLKMRKKRRKVPRTTDSSHNLPLYPNLVKEIIPQAANEIWVSDITYIAYQSPKSGAQKFSYLSLVMDSYSKEIKGWSLGANLSTAYPLAALEMALKTYSGRGHLIHHSDRGVQYASSKYISVLKKHGIEPSMTESGDPKDNAQAERVNNTMKNELLYGKTFYSIEEVRDAVSKAVDFYNNKRPHMSLNMLTPREAAGLTGDIQKRWRSRREEYIKAKGAEESTEIG